MILELAIYSLYLSMQSPAPASSLAEPPPAASPQLGRFICQEQGLQSASIRGLLLVLAPASAAAASAAAAGTAAAASTTTTPCLFTFLVTFHTGKYYKILTGYPTWLGSNVYVYVVHGFLHCQLLSLLLHPANAAKSVSPGLLW